jgi:hypothetical protein
MKNEMKKRERERKEGKEEKGEKEVEVFFFPSCVW